jgi:hypothetical protein
MGRCHVELPTQSCRQLVVNCYFKTPLTISPNVRLTPDTTISQNTSILLAIMSPRNEVFQAIPFDASSDASEALIAAGDAAEEDPRLEEKAFSRFKFSSLLLGLLVGFFIQLATLGVNLLVISIWGGEIVKSKTKILVFCMLWSFFYSAMAFVILGITRDLVTITYSAGGGRSNDFLEYMLFHMECRFIVGALVGINVAWIVTDLLLGSPAPIMYSFGGLAFAILWVKIVTMCFPTYSKPLSSRRLTAEQTMMAV